MMAHPTCRSKQSKIVSRVLVILTILYQITLNAFATNISYQGTLDIAGVPANGMYDFRVSLYDSIELGSQIPGSNAPLFENIVVEEGLVNLSINFGVGVFDGSARFIQIEVRDSASTGNYTILQPRQEVLPAPQSENSNLLNGDLFQRGTIGDCNAPGSVPVTGSFNFPVVFSAAPILFLSGDESGDQGGCFAEAIYGRSETGFTWVAINADGMISTCDCLHWLAIGPP